MAAHLVTLRKEHGDLVSERKAVEDAYYNVATTESDMEESFAKSKIATARLEPQKNARLQSIHEAHQAVLSKEAEIRHAEIELTTCKAQRRNLQKPIVSQAKAKQLEAEVCNSLSICLHTPLI